MVNRIFKPVQSLQRGLKLLEVISGRREGVALKELAEAISCSPPAAYHLVQTLADAGFVHRLETPVRYVLGEKFRMLAGTRQSDRFYSVAFECMRELHKALPEASITFSECAGGSVIVAATLLPRISKQIIREVRPQPLPAYASAGSLAHYAFWSPEMRDAYHEKNSFPVYGIPFWGSAKNFEKAVARLRKDRLFLMPNEAKPNLKLALPLFYPEGGMAGAFTLQWNSADSRHLAKRKDLLVSKAGWISKKFTQDLDS